MRRRRLSLVVKLAAVVLVVAGGVWLIVRPPVFLIARMETATPAESRPTIEFDRFSARHERSDEGSRLTVSVRLRTTADQPMPCYVFLLASSERTPKAWAIWPPQSAGPAVTSTGHFHGASPTLGYPVTLTTSWQRVTATLPDPPSGGPFDLVVAYVVSEAGGVLLSRPFHPL